MAEIIPGQGRTAGPLFHIADGSGLRRRNSQACMPVGIVNPEDITVAISGVNVEVDSLEELMTSGNSYAASGNTFLEQIANNTDQLEVIVSGVELNTDDLEALSGSGNTYLASMEALLTSISGSVDGLEALQTTANGSLSNIDGNTDGIEALLTSISGTNDGVIRDTDGTAADVTAVSGSANALYVQVDSVLTTSELLASGNINGGAFSSNLDVSSQVGFYNNALFIGSNQATDIEIYANSDGGSDFALVETLTFAAVNTFLYYDLAGYESTVKIKPVATGDYQIDLVRNR